MAAPRGEQPTNSTAGDAPAARPEGPWTVLRLIRWIQGHLEAKSIDSPRVSAEILIGHVLGCDRLRLYMEPERIPTDAERGQLRELVARASRHEPVQYLVGAWPFRGRSFEVDSSTLIPRPATEALVEAAVRWYRETMFGEPLRMADIGTGTGVIAVSVLAEIRDGLQVARGRTGCRPLGGAARATPDVAPIAEIQIGVEGGASPRPMLANVSFDALPQLSCIATELVPAAAALARRNTERYALAHDIEVREGSLFEPFMPPSAGLLDGTFDLICSNPPYISDAEWADVPPNVKDYEPATALRAGRDGLDVIRPLIHEAPRWLRRGGLLCIEIAHSQPNAVRSLFAAAAGTWTDVAILKDHEDFWRVATGRRG